MFKNRFDVHYRPVSTFGRTSAICQCRRLLDLRLNENLQKRTKEIVYNDSAPSLGVYYFLSLTLSVCMSRCSFKSLLLYCFSMESSHFWPVSSPCGALQNCFSSIFDLGPLFLRPKFTPQNLQLYKITCNYRLV